MRHSSEIQNGEYLLVQLLKNLRGIRYMHHTQVDHLNALFKGTGVAWCLNVMI